MQLEKKKRKRPGRPTSGNTLTPQAVAEGAAQLIDDEGMAEFSMRRLGQALSVEAMALYNHFSDKEAIVDAVANLTLARIPVPPPKGSWRTRIRTIAAGIRDLAHQRPNLFRLAFTRRTMPTAALPITEAVLTALSEVGVSPDAQISAYHTIHMYVRGFCLWELEQFRSLPPDQSPHAPPINGQYPRAAAAKQEIFTPDLDREFEAGLDLILRGISAQMGRRRHPG